MHSDYSILKQNIIYPLGLVNSILTSALRKRIHEIHHFMEHPHEVQAGLLQRLLESGRNTEFGRKHGFSTIRNLEDYQNRFPVSSYEQFFPYIERMMQGEHHILWPGKTKWFSKSSGTTNAKSKFIPVSREALYNCHYKGGKDLLSLYLNNNPQSSLFNGKGLSIGGSYAANPVHSRANCGDISAIIMANLPSWAQYIRTPDVKTALMSEWESKLEKIARITQKQHVTSISGVPTWTCVLLEKILQLTGKKNILEVWPEFEVFFHGGVAFAPYKEMFKRFFPNQGTHYVETYTASEGFFGIQDRLDSEDLLLLLDYGIFYEFLPVEEADKEFPATVSLQDVQLHKNYALVISTNAGLWRYKIGDTVKFTSLKPYRIKVSGRTKHFINAFGEELIIENAESAISLACERSGAVISNFTAAPLYFKDNAKGGHEWIIEFAIAPRDLSVFTEILDSRLKELNSDYEAKRYRDLALQRPVIHSVPEGTFYKWMKRNGKLGGQHKVPRLSNSREYIDEILNEVVPTL